MSELTLSLAQSILNTALAEARALIISASDFTAPAVHTCREFLQHKLVALCHLEEIVRLKPSSSKGRYIQKGAVSTTFGPGIPLDVNAI